MGAFGVKDNAERMLKDLVSKGFNAFITTIWFLLKNML
jgi:cell division septation protein DedD